jgi:hypothetical protein
MTPCCGARKTSQPMSTVVGFSSPSVAKRSARHNPVTEIRHLLFRTESTTCNAFSRPAVRFRPIAVYLTVENLDVPMMFQGTKPGSPRGSAMVNVKTIGGRRSRYWCGPGSVRANQNGARLSESSVGALQILFLKRKTNHENSTQHAEDTRFAGNRSANPHRDRCTTS